MHLTKPHNPFLSVTALRTAFSCALTACGILAVLLASPAASAHGGFRAGFRVNSYSLSTQIGGNDVTSIAQTSDGYLWVGTPVGLFRFDSDRFLPATEFLQIPRLPVEALLADGDTLYVGTVGRGVFRIAGSNVTQFDIKSGLADDVVWEFTKTRTGSIWIATSGGLSELDGTTVTRLAPGSTGIISHVAQDRHGNLVFSDAEGALFRKPANGDLSAMPSNSPVFALASGPRNHLWIGSESGLKVAKHIDAEPADEPALGSEAIVALAAGDSGYLWAATGAGDLWQQTATGWKHRHLVSRLPNTNVNTLFIDSQDSLWIGTRDGLAQVTGGAVVELGPTLSGPDVWAVTYDRDGFLWMATGGGGISRVDASVPRLIALDTELPSNEIWSLAPSPGGGLWAGSSNAGAFLIRDGKVLRQVDDLPVKNVWSILETPEGVLLIGTDGGGLVRLSGSDRTVFDTQNGMAGNRIWALHDDPNSGLWVGTNRGLCRVAGDKVDCQDTEDGLPGNAVWSVSRADRNGLWVSTDGGLAYVNLDGSISAVTREPLASANVFGVATDAEDNLWALSAQGLHRVARDEIPRLRETGRSPAPLGRTFGPADGLNQTLSSGASPPMALDAEGRLWLATQAGLAMVRTDTLHRYSVPVTLRVESLYADGEPLDVAADAGRIPAGPRVLTIGYSVLAFRYPGEALVEYRLLGLSDRWSAPTRDRELAFSNLPPGDFKLEIRLAANDFGMTGQPVSFAFNVKPFWHQRAAIRLGLILALVLLMTAAYRMRMNQLLARHREREAQTERALAAARAVSESEQRYHNVIANVTDLLFSAGPDNRIIDANPAAKALLPKCENGQKLDDVVPAEGIEAVAHGPWQWQLTTLDGKERTLELRCARGSVAEWLFVARDISDAMALQRRLEATARMESIGKLTAGVAHDFNNLLTVIRGNASILAEELHNDRNKPLAQAIVDASGYAADITSKLLSIGQRQTVRAERINLNELLRKMEPVLGNTLPPGIRLQLELGADAVVEADSTLLQQIVLNLVMNARDAIAGDGEITIRTQMAGPDELPSKTDDRPRPAGHVLLNIHDTGEGMGKGTLAQAFEPFFSTKDPSTGTGLGLATVYGAVTQCDGQIWIDSEVGAGTIVHVRLPVVAEQSDTIPEEPEGGSIADGESILVADDDSNILDLVSRTLGAHGYQVTTAATVEDAVHAREHREFDLLLSDIVIGDGSGPQLVAALRAGGCDTPVLYMSGYAYAHKANLNESDAKLLAKPFDKNQLLQAVRRALTNHDKKNAGTTTVVPAP